MKLLKSRDLVFSKEYNTIFTITNRLIKEVKFIPINKAINAPGTAYIVIREVIVIEDLLDK
jgi:hypothetical protein